MSEYTDEYTELLGAYALDAVDDDEREAIERHLLDCPRCRAEVSEHREVAAVLSQTGSPAPEGVWDRIAADLSPPAPPLRITLAAPGTEGAAPEAAPAAPVASLADQRRRRSKTMIAIVGIAASIVAILGVVAVGQSQRLNKLETAMSDRSMEELADEVEADAVLEAELTGTGGTARAVVSDTGRGFLIVDDVAEVPAGDVYQLWGKVDDVVLSLGTFGHGEDVVPFSVDPNHLDDVELFAVTQEKAPGVPSSENEAALAGTV